MSGGKSDSGYVISAIDDTIVRKIGEIAAYVERERKVSRDGLKLTQMEAIGR